MIKVNTLIKDFGLSDTAKIHQISSAAFALDCYIMGQVDKWEYLKPYILLGQEK
jgi:hypothetical protein